MQEGICPERAKDDLTFTLPNNSYCTLEGCENALTGINSKEKGCSLKDTCTEYKRMKEKEMEK